eukprot:4258966-Pyramimonas_sp.AAC.1
MGAIKDRPAWFSTWNHPHGRAAPVATRPEGPLRPQHETFQTPRGLRRDGTTAECGSIVRCSER